MIQFTEPLCMPAGAAHQWNELSANRLDGGSIQTVRYCIRCRVTHVVRSQPVNNDYCATYAHYRIPEGPSKWQR